MLSGAYLLFRPLIQPSRRPVFLFVQGKMYNAQAVGPGNNDKDHIATPCKCLYVPSYQGRQLLRNIPIDPEKLKAPYQISVLPFHLSTS